MLLLQFPAIFSPESWSFTFYEGLLRIPPDDFFEKSCAELGSGNGWVSIALATSHSLRSMHGYDLNPKAVVCATLNLILNSFDLSGQPILDPVGVPVLSKVAFFESDLLSQALDLNRTYHKIIGCIPQVLNPDPTTLNQRPVASLTDDQLYDLSNYCEPQGYLEDRFGLGLIAKAIEQAIVCLKPWGSLILNLGGRPGRATLEKMFYRRGFTLNEVWSTFVEQAMDTEIQKLIEIEKISAHRFEFYLNGERKLPISASAAFAFAKTGGRISHKLTVYEAKLPSPKETAQILEFVGSETFKNLHASMDLSTDDGEVFRERVKFLSFLTTILKDAQGIPYGPSEGLWSLRTAFAAYCRYYFGAKVGPNHVLAAPTRQSLIGNHILLFAPRLALIDRRLLLSSAGRVIRTSAEFVGTEILELPCKAHITLEFINALKPDLVVTGLTEFENQSESELKALIAQTEKFDCRLIVDISDHLDFSSQPGENAALGLLSHSKMPKHVAYAAELVKNKVYSDLDLCFLLTNNQTYLELATRCAEFTFCRVPLLHQHYYEKLIGDLLEFHLADARGIEAEAGPLVSDPTLKPRPEAISAFNQVAIGNTGIPINERTIRLDYGENCLPLPHALTEAIFEGFLIKQMARDSFDSKAAVLAWLKRFCNVTNLDTLIEGLGVAPLFTAFLTRVKARGETLVVPTGCYGEFLTAATLLETKVERVTTSEAESFKLTAGAVEQFLAGHSLSKVWIFINAPFVNPTAASYSRSELAALATVAEKHGAGIAIDATFQGLGHSGSEEYVDCAVLNKTDWILFGTVSKLFAAGGLRYGFAACPDHNLNLALLQTGVNRPHRTVRYAIKALFDKMLNADPAITSYLERQNQILRDRAARLSERLTGVGFEVLPPHGGLFLVAKSKKISGDALARKLFDKTDLLVNGDSWTGVPGYVRFVLSVTDESFEEALRRLRDFRGG